MLRSHLTRGQHGVSQLGLDEGDVAIYPEPYLAPVWVLGSRGDSDSDSDDRPPGGGAPTLWTPEQGILGADGESLDGDAAAPSPGWPGGRQRAATDEAIEIRELVRSSQLSSARRAPRSRTQRARVSGAGVGRRSSSSWWAAALRLAPPPPLVLIGHTASFTPY